MEHQQKIRCDTSDCLHWKDGFCTTPELVSIQKHQCANFEHRPSRSIIVALEGGLVEYVFASPDLKDIHLEILDLDSQEFTHLEDQERDRNRFEEIKEQYIQIN